MTESNERDAWIEAELRSLHPSGRDVLGVLAVCGRASLSVDELAEITELPEVLPTLADLEKRGLVVRERDRYSLAPPAQGPLNRVLASVDVVDRVLRGFIRIAEDGRLTLGDLDAVVELTGIAAKFGRWKELLRLAEAAEATLSTTHRVEDWIEIAKRRGEAGQALEDERAIERAEQDLAKLRASTPSGGGVRLMLTALAAAAVGVGVGYLVSNQSSDETVTEAGAAAETVTETAGAETETVTETATSTTIETVTETITSTTTVEITVEGPPPAVE
jgi:hypothetical protein